jgi:hypothetical protein
MIPMKHSSIFKSRWMALLWAAGILWFAYDFAAPDSEASNMANPIPSDDQNKAADALNAF